MLASWPYFENGINIELSNPIPSVFLTEKVKSGKWYLLFLEQPTVLVPHIHCHKVMDGWSMASEEISFQNVTKVGILFVYISVIKVLLFQIVLHWINRKAYSFFHIYLLLVTTRRQNVKSRPIWQKMLSKKVLRLSI